MRAPLRFALLLVVLGAVGCAWARANLSDDAITPALACPGGAGSGGACDPVTDNENQHNMGMHLHPMRDAGPTCWFDSSTGPLPGSCEDAATAQ